MQLSFQHTFNILNSHHVKTTFLSLMDMLNCCQLFVECWRRYAIILLLNVENMLKYDT